MEPIGTGDILPHLEVEDVGGRRVSLRPSGRLAVVVVLVHEPGCDVCHDYLRRLAAAHAEHSEWDGRVVAVVPSCTGEVAASPLTEGLGFEVLADSERRAWAAFGVAATVVLIADQWGELHYVSPPASPHAFPPPDEVTSWLRFLSIRCPECEGEAL